MNTKILILPIVAALAGCESISDRLTSTKPDAVPCHGYAPLDTVVAGDTVEIGRAHVCGTPRAFPDKKAA